MMNLLRSIKVNKSGASAAEYALMIAVMGGLVVVAIGLLGNNITNALTGSATNVTAAQALND